MPKGIYVRTEEIKEKLRKAQLGSIGYWLGKARSQETKNKIGKAHKGKVISAETKLKMSIAFTGRKHREDSKLKMSIARKGIPFSEDRRIKMRGRKVSKEQIEKMVATRMKNDSYKHTEDFKINLGNRVRGDKCNLWRGGITPVNKKIRNSLEYKSWRTAVFKRDDYTCVLCSIRGVELNADHIKPFSVYPELRFDLSNGRTLCVPCHKNTDTFSLRGRKLSELHKKRISESNRKK